MPIGKRLSSARGVLAPLSSSTRLNASLSSSDEEDTPLPLTKGGVRGGASSDPSSSSHAAVVEDDEPRMVTRRRRLVISFARPPRPQHGHGADAAVSAGRVAGCRVTDGVVRKGAKIRTIRDGVVIQEMGTLQTLKRFKDEVNEVQSGQECGMNFGFQDIKVGDVIECFTVEEIQRSL